MPQPPFCVHRRAGSCSGVGFLSLLWRNDVLLLTRDHANMRAYARFAEAPHMSFMEMERRQLTERANGKLARALGLALPGESQEELDRMAQEDERRARAGLVELRRGDQVCYKHIDQVTPQERQYRLEAEKVRNGWLRGRVERLRNEQNYSC